eukprot:COSAG05_NODE_4604_length_1442_cov_1.236039_1_plen_60_part_10
MQCLNTAGTASSRRMPQWRPPSFTADSPDPTSLSSASQSQQKPGSSTDKKEIDEPSLSLL